MISAGNDIVSFAATNLIRTKQPAFYSKILAAQEITAYAAFDNGRLAFENYVWMLWSVKEAVYKYLKRHNPGLIFSPTGIITAHLKPAGIIPQDFTTLMMEGKGFKKDTTWTGTAGFAGHQLYFSSLLYTNILHTVVNDRENFDDVYWGIQSVADSSSQAQSAAVRAFLLARLQLLLNGATPGIIKNQHGVPVVVYNKQDLPLPVSLSHHGNFVAYSFKYSPFNNYPLP